MRNLILLVSLGMLFACSSKPALHEVPGDVEVAPIGEVRNVHRVANLWLAGQPTEADLPLLADSGFEVVISLRSDGEVKDFDEAQQVEDLGMIWLNPGFRSPDQLTDEYFDELRALLRQHREDNVLLHCGSANRVGAVWLPYRVLDEGVPFEKALLEATVIGLRSEALQAKAVAYTRARMGELEG